MLYGEMTHEVLDWVSVGDLTKLDEQPAKAILANTYGLRVGDRVNFSKQGDGTVTGFQDDGISVSFDNGKVLPSIPACVLKKLVEAVRPAPGKSWHGIQCHPETLEEGNIVAHAEYGKRTVAEVEGTMVRLEFQDGNSPWVPISTLTFTSTAKPDLHAVGTRVRHLKFGDGTVKGAEGKTVLVAFDDAETRKVLPAFLQIVEPSADPHANFQHQETADNVVRIPVVKPQAMDC
jgi:hypothetical protein